MKKKHLTLLKSGNTGGLMQISDLMHDYFSGNNSQKNIDLTSEPAQTYHKWEIVDSPERLLKDYSFNSREPVFEFLRQMFLFEDNAHHHAKITVENTNVRIEVYTHEIEKVTELDTDYAGVADQVYSDITGLL